MKLRNKKRIVIAALLGLTLLLTGCPNSDKTYTLSNEEYLLGWTLHNIDNTTPTDLTYSYNELSVYNYTYNYPTYSSRTFDKVQYWIAPFQQMALSSIIRVPVPLNRVIYLKGSNAYSNSGSIYPHDWSYYQLMYINYITGNDTITSFYDYTNTEFYGPNFDNPFDSIKPSPGQMEQVYFGTSPYTPASVIVRGTYLKLNGPLLKGYDGKSYLMRHLSGDFEQVLPPPTYKIYLNDVLKQEGNFTPLGSSAFGRWEYSSLDYYLGKDGNYFVEVSLSSGYPVFSKVLVKSSFFKDAGTSEIKMPVLKHIEFPSRFNLNEYLPIRLDFENQEQIVDVLMYYKTNVMDDWSLISDKNTASLSITDNDAKEINFKFIASTNEGKATYEIYPISLKAIDVFCDHNLSYDINNNTFLNGECLDDKENPVSGIHVVYYSHDELLGQDKTEIGGMYSSSFNKNLDTVETKFQGTGVYNAIRDKVPYCIDPDSSPDYSLMNIDYLITPQKNVDLYLKGFAKAGYSYSPNSSGISKRFKVIIDNCDGNSVIESYCTANQTLLSAKIACPNGCANGFCISNGEIDSHEFAMDGVVVPDYYFFQWDKDGFIYNININPANKLAIIQKVPKN